MILDIILPVFGIVTLGYLATYTQIFDRQAARGLSVFVFQFAMPVMLFLNMAKAELPTLDALALPAAYYGGSAIIYLLGMALGRPPFDRRTIIGFGGAYSNNVLLGIPLVAQAFGEAGLLPLFVIIAGHAPLFFTGTTVLLEIGQGGGTSLRALPWRILRSLVTNVILIAILAGLAWNIAGLPLPGAMTGFAELLARAALPGALFSMGASLRDYRIIGALGPATLMVAIKLVVHPALIALLVLYVVDVPPLWAAVAIIAASLPVGINVYLFAGRFGVGEAESATAILLSNLISIVTVSITLALVLPLVDGAAGP